MQESSSLIRATQNPTQFEEARRTQPHAQTIRWIPDGSSQVINTQQHRQQGRQVPSRYLTDLSQGGSNAQKKRKMPQLSAKALLANKKEKTKDDYVSYFVSSAKLPVYMQIRVGYSVSSAELCVGYSVSEKDEEVKQLKDKFGKQECTFDDIWAVVDLVELGIPHPRSNDNSTKQYKRKVIFTTRSEELCTKMRADEKIKVECLEPQEAWDLFKENVDLDVIASDVRMKEIARKVMNECSGLPLTLILIGKAMSNKKNFEEWDYVLRSMRKSKTSIIQDVEKSLYPTLEISYDNLPNKLCKDCFLYISLWPRGVGISNEDIIDFWIGLGLIHEFDNLREAYGHGQYILRLLEAACLLEPYEKAYMDFKKDLRLHDVIRDMALWIVAKSEARNIWIANANMGLNRISNVAAKKLYRNANMGLNRISNVAAKKLYRN
ncbi:disease resistance protein RPS5-like [Dioscorea cayenensis subsp. rotundata]|uniref:Disease resistance protein RPS5-like n=1 Tax=Dioscorea cayennensis subsp. rotundata TaxID=55577 RepID=A0AB40CFS5_DIOCR|nr:disease resistance protein RPS5-like [Dioscorea cayenensis subsp. rotundata]